MKKKITIEKPNWFSRSTKRRVIYDYPIGTSPLMSLLTEFDKVYSQLQKLEKRAQKLLKNIKRARKAAK